MGVEMPWEHCGESINEDHFRCPECGVSKGAWTIQVDQTRLFALGRGAWKGDVEAQVQALESAGEKGIPFCQKCEQVEPAEDADSAS
jgi:hypothetical protein